MHRLPLEQEALTYKALKERLLVEHVDLDWETLTDTLEGITDLHEMIAAVIRSALVDDALSTGLRTRLGEMKERLASIE